MAEPDHATNTVHAASGYAYPRDLNLILAFLKGKVDPLPGFWVEKSALERSMAYFAARGVERLGFEGFIEERHAVLFPSPPQVKSNKRLSLDGYFRTMADLSQGAIRDKGFPVPIGVRKHPYATEADQAALGALGANYSFFPAIDFGDAAEKDIKHTVEGVHPNENAKAADMLGKKGFDHKYRYETVYGRELVGQPDEGAPAGDAKLEPGVAAEIRVEFGPEPAGFDAPPERMESVSVFIGGHTVPGRLVDNGTAWVGRFTPVLEDGEDVRELQIEIHGRDAHAHAPLRGRLALPDLKDLTSDRGYLLDSEPDSPAKTSSENLSAYHVASYQPGPDRNFRVAVGRASPREKPAEEAAAGMLPAGAARVTVEIGVPGEVYDIWSATAGDTADFAGGKLDERRFMARLEMKSPLPLKEMIEAAPPPARAAGPETPKALFEKGEQLLKERDYWGATEYFRKTLDAFPMEANQGLGLCYYGAGLVEAALRHFAEAYRLEPRSRLTILYLATCSDKLGRRDEAVRRHEKKSTSGRLYL